MAAAKCPLIIKFCAVRVTVLEDDGTPTEDYYVSDKTVTLTYTPVISEGQDREVRNGCDCIIGSDKAPDILKRFTFEVAQGVFEPGLRAMMLGQTPITDGDGNTIGINYHSNTLTCGGAPYVSIEGWSQAYDVDHPDADYPWSRVIWPSTQWQIAPTTLSADFAQFPMTGFSRGNDNYGDPYNDFPDDGTGLLTCDFFAEFLQAEDPPTAVCGLQTAIA